MKRATAALMVASFTACGAVHAAELRANPLPTGSAIVLDGRLDDVAWQDVPVASQFFETSPRDGRPAAMATSVRVAFDATHLYIGVDGLDENPSEIRAPFARRDKTFAEQDLFQLFIDPTGERKAAQFFRINPRGAVSDGVYTETGGEDFSPDFLFEAAAQRSATGWSAEFRIPFTSLAGDGSAQDWTLLVIRNMPRADRIRYANTLLPRDNNCLLCYSPVLLGLSEPRGGRNWLLMPQFTAGRRSNEVGHHDQVQVSLDAKVRLTPQTVVDLTVNPDFSQIEIDLPVLSGNRRFSVLLPEKRPFFLEGADLLVSPLNIMHTRSITDPAWGVRSTYRSDHLNLTMLTARDQGGGSVILPGAYTNAIAEQDFSSQASVLRATTSMGKLTLGSLLSDRTLSNDRGYNRVAGSDAVWQVADSTRLRGQLLYSATTALPDSDGRLRASERRDGYAAYVDIDHDVGTWRVHGLYQDIGDDFRADNGFVTQAGVRGVAVEMMRRFYHDGTWRERSPYLNFSQVQDHDGRTVMQSLTPGLYLAGPRSIGLNLEWHAGECITLTPGADPLRRDYGRVAIDISPNAWLNRVVVEVEGGDQIDYENGRLGKGGLVNLFARWRLLDRLEMEQNYSHFWVDERNGANDRIYSETALTWSAIWHFSTRDSVRLIWQRESLRRNPFAYVEPVASKSGTEEHSVVYAHVRGYGSAFYLGWSQARSLSNPATQSQELFAKFSWAF